MKETLSSPVVLGHGAYHRNRKQVRTRYKKEKYWTNRGQNSKRREREVWGALTLACPSLSVGICVHPLPIPTCLSRAESHHRFLTGWCREQNSKRGTVFNIARGSHQLEMNWSFWVNSQLSDPSFILVCARVSPLKGCPIRMPTAGTCSLTDFHCSLTSFPSPCLLTSTLKPKPCTKSFFSKSSNNIPYLGLSSVTCCYRDQSCKILIDHVWITCLHSGPKQQCQTQTSWRKRRNFPDESMWLWRKRWPSGQADGSCTRRVGMNWQHKVQITLWHAFMQAQRQGVWI